MLFHCCAFGCTNRQKKGSNLKFYRLPADEDRRRRWLAALKRKDWSPSPYSRLCNQHFISGEKSIDPLSPDYIPSLFTSTSTPTKDRNNASLHRYIKTQARKKRQRENFDRSLAASVLLELSSGGTVCEKEETMEVKEEQPGMCVKVDIASEPAKVTESLVSSAGTSCSCKAECDALKKQCQSLQEEVYALRAQVKSQSDTEESLTGNDEKVKFYTGLQSFQLLQELFFHIERHICDVKGVSKFQQFLLTLMRLRLNLTFQDLAYRFGIHASTASRTILQGTLPITMLELDKTTNLTCLDKVVRVCCALINVNDSVVPFN
ncbi:uncharacterized protein KZ484_012436 [Pholidichthys leucotaenia]